MASSLVHGIHTIDTDFHRPRFDAAYLVVERGRGAFIDCGLNSSAPRLLAALAEVELAPADVDWLILTHVHLDHAGGAGLLLSQLPNARLVVHPRGAPHMIDPSRLIAGASAVYGADEVARTYGQLVPVPADRVVEARDGHVVDLAGRPLLCLDAPGHARHHIVIFDAASRCFFTGDTFGLSYRELDSAAGPFILPTTTPVQFEPEALKASIQRMLSHQPLAMYLTHYGRVDPPERLALALLEQIDAMVALAERYAASSAAERHAALCAGLRKLYCERARKHGCGLDESEVAKVLEMDIELNAQGLGVWLDRRDAA
ncbi:MAG: MBL fold metallo-hydrolase [Aquimonas sp.]|nr:MBL fold metallo-hydrolase [Aquimonas sp.]